MKKLLLSIASVIALAGAANAQGLTIYLDGTSTDIAGGSHNYELTSDVVNEHLVDFLYNNLSGSAEDWIITREIISEPAGWSNYFCWGADGMIGNCYPASSDVLYNSNPENIAAQGAGRLSTYVTSPSSGSATYRYHVSTDGQTYINHVDLIVTSVLSLEEQAPVLAVTVAPNPASDYITINASGVNTANVKMVDVLGNVVLNSAVQTKKSINVTKFRNGIYFVIVEAEGAKAVTRKVIVRH